MMPRSRGESIPSLEEIVEMPANNLSVVFRRLQAPVRA
jgi:hypothetical protein